jgi:hypothetical protein
MKAAVSAVSSAASHPLATTLVHAVRPLYRQAFVR